MRVFKVVGSVAEKKYRGAGMAIAAVTGGVIVNMVYLRDVIEDLDEDDQSQLMDSLDDPRLAPAVRELQAQGELFVGMCSCLEFIVR